MLAAALALRLLLEAILLVIFAIWGFHAVDAWPARLAAGLAAPAAAAMFWRLLISPSRRFDPGRIPRLLLELDLFALAAAALWQLGWPIAGALLFGVAALDRFGLIWLRRREIERRYKTY